MKKGYFGKFGGMFVSELLVKPLQEVTVAFEKFKKIDRRKRNLKNFCAIMSADRLRYTMPKIYRKNSGLIFFKARRFNSWRRA